MTATEPTDARELVTGWRLDPAERAGLLRRFPPRYGETVADHVTFEAHLAVDAPLPAERDGEVVGRADDDEGVEALVVRIGGTTDRPDGSTWHITWSLAHGREAVESNTVIAERGWAPVEPPIPLTLRPASFS